MTRPGEHSSKLRALYCCEKSSAAGALWFFVSAAVAGEAIATAAQSAAELQNAKPTARPKEDIAGPKRENKLIVRLKIVVG